MAIIVNGDGILTGVSSLATALTDLTSGRGTVTGVATVGTLQLGAGVSMGSPRSQNAAIFTNNSEFLTVDDAGRVGVGTVTPNSDAHPQNVGKINVGFITARSIAGDIDGNTLVVAGISTFVGAINGNVTGNISGGTVAGSTGTFTGDVSIADKIVHTGDTNTAIRFSGADTIKLETAGTERFQVDSSGNIYVGGVGGSATAGTLWFNDTSANASKIAQSNGNSALTFHTGSSQPERLRIDSSGRLGIQGAATRALLEVRASGGSNTMLTALWGANEGTTAGTLTDNTDKAVRMGVHHYDTDALPFGLLTASSGSSANTINFGGGTSLMNAATQIQFTTAANTTTASGSTRVIIDSNGRVLIGVNASYANNSIDELQIGNNSSSNQSGITIGSTDECAIAFADAGDARAGSMTYNHAADAMIFKINGQNEYFRVHTNGVKVNSASDAIMEMHTSNGTAHSRINFSNNNGDNTGGIWYSSSNHMQFRTASDYQFTISATNGRLERSFGAGSGTDADGMWFNNDQSATGTFVRFWQTSGGYGANQIGTIAHTANNTAYNTSSDYRLKENAVAISDGITRLKTLKPYRFNFKTEPSKTVDGFFAHEAATAVPEAVTGTKDEVATIADTSIGVAVGDPVHQGMDYGKITPLLTAALQEAITKIETLETKVAALEGG